MQQLLISAIIQAVLAAAVLATVYYFALAAAMQDSLVVTSTRPKSMIEVAAGKVPLNTSFVTDKRLTMSGREIIDLPRSMNTKGGAQFSYSFWIKLPEYSRGDFKRVVLYRGDKTTAEFTDPAGGKSMQLPMTFCPLVIVKRHGKDTYVSCHVNAQRDKNFSCTAKSVSGETPVNWTKWNLVTVSVSDVNLYGAANEGAVSCSVWLNQVENKQVGDVKIGGLLENSGDLHILPTDKFGDVSCHGQADIEVRDITYANYAMSSSDIYTKIANEADRTVIPYKMHRTESNSQAFWDLSMQHLSV
jgi:hypothetical protein